MSAYSDTIKRNPNKKDVIFKCCESASDCLPVLCANYISAVEREIHSDINADATIKVVSIHDAYFNEAIAIFRNKLNTEKYSHGR